MTKKYVLRVVFSLLLLAAVSALYVGCKKDSSPTGPSGGAGSVITVTGKVVNSNLLPLASVPVLISGKASVNTDANGNFTVTSVTTPYDATVIEASGKRALIYRNLTRSDPTLFSLGTASLPNAAAMSGSVYPTSAFPQPATRLTGVALVAPEVTVWVQANGAVSPATFSFPSLQWAGATTISATLHALQWDVDASNLPVTYVRYGKRSNVSITNGGTFAGVNDTMSTTPGTLTFSGSVSIPAGYAVASKTIMEQFGGKTAFPIAADPATSTSFSYKTPDLSGGTIGLMATASKGSAISMAYASGLASNSTSASLTLPAAPELSLPVDAAPSVKAGTQFSWNAFPGGMHLVYFNGPAGQPDYYIMTTAASDSLPNLASAGLPLPASAGYSWQVMGFAPFANMDAATGSSGFLPVGFPYYVTSGTGSLGISASRTFTTAP